MCSGSWLVAFRQHPAPTRKNAPRGGSPAIPAPCPVSGDGRRPGSGPAAIRPGEMAVSTTMATATPTAVNSGCRVVIEARGGGQGMVAVGLRCPVGLGLPWAWRMWGVNLPRCCKGSQPTHGSTMAPSSTTAGRAWGLVRGPRCADVAVTYRHPPPPAGCGAWYGGTYRTPTYRTLPQRAQDSTETR